LLVYKGFSVPVFEDFAGDGFPTLARGAPILLGFPRFRCFFGGDFLKRGFCESGDLGHGVGSSSRSS
jgi:hypothetical protein